MRDSSLSPEFEDKFIHSPTLGEEKPTNKHLDYFQREREIIHRALKQRVEKKFFLKDVLKSNITVSWSERKTRTKMCLKDHLL